MCALDAEFPLPPVAVADPRFLRGAARHAHSLLAATRPDLSHAADAELWIERAVIVLARNVASGRFAHASQYQQDASPSAVAYAQQVLTQLMSEWERIEALRAGDTSGWIVVLQRMERLAYFWLGPAGREEWAKSEARELAAKTCADLWRWLQRNPFPFDVPFDRWSERALRHRLTASARSRRRQDRYVVESLDRPCFEDGGTLGELLPTDDMSVWLELESQREVLRQAYAQLDQRLARIVHLWYVEGWSAGEIAAETRLEVGHIYVLKHRALKKLRAYCASE